MATADVRTRCRSVQLRKAVLRRADRVELLAVHSASTPLSTFLVKLGMSFCNHGSLAF